MSGLPTGTVTFLFTDIEGSTRLLQQVGDEPAAAIFQEHRRLMREAFRAGGGHELQSEGDGFLAVFQSAREAVLTALAAQRAVATHPWPDNVDLRVRMGLHTGEPASAPGGYVGLDIHRAHRICSVGWGGQILLSDNTRRLVERELPPEAGLRDLGSHRLKDLLSPESIYQVLHPDLRANFPPLRSLDTLPNNLPRQLTSFVGRQQEMVEVKRLLRATRLLTLTGPGGSGKTRLALQVAADLVDAFRDGVWLVELAALSDPGLVPQAVASALHVREQPGRPLLATLTDYLQEKDLLLLLDNCEHLIGPCAHVAELLLRACPGLRILATSQEPMRVAGETTWHVPSLPLLDLGRLPPLERLAQNDAVRLFNERAAAVVPDFHLTNQNAPWVAQVCYRLDGIPLAIELAAARVKVLPVEQIAARLDDRFRLLTGGSRTVLPRHQTLRATMDWSHSLLPEQERQLLWRVSVFVGGFTLEAAEAVCSGSGIEPGDILDLLAHLVDRSLVNADAQRAEARYSLLETVRQYALEKLANAGGTAQIRQRHLDWFLAMTAQAEAAPAGSEEIWHDRLEVEHDNLRGALDFSLHGGGPEAGLRLAWSLRRFWLVRGYWSEGRRWLETLLAQASQVEDSLRARSLTAAAQLARSQADYERAQILSEEGLRLFRARGDREGTASALNVLGNIMYERGDYPAARRYHQEGLQYARDAGDTGAAATSLLNLAVVADHEGDFARAAAYCEQSLELFKQIRDRRGIAAVHNMLGVLASDQGDHATARARLHESLALSRELGDKRGIASSLSSLGRVAQQQGDYAAARAYFEEGLTIRRELGDRHGLSAGLRSLGLLAWRQGDRGRAAALLEESLAMRRAQGNRLGVAECLEGLAMVASDPARAARWLGAASGTRQALGAPLSPAERADHDGTVAVLRAALGPAGFQTAWDEGRGMSLDQAVQEVLAVRTS